MKRQAAAYLVLMTVMLCASGASCPTLRQPLSSPAPTLFAGPPTQQEVIAAINATSGQIRQLQTDSATLSVQGMPTLRASLAAGPPRNFRLRAALSASARCWTWEATTKSSGPWSTRRN